MKPGELTVRPERSDRPPGGGRTPIRLTLTRTPEGEYRRTGLVLTPDDDSDGFTITYGFAVYRFKRER